MRQPLLTRYLQPMLAGRRWECMRIIHDALASGTDAGALLDHVIGPAVRQTETLYREDQINAALENMASRINRTVADQLQVHLPRRPPNGNRVLVVSGETGREEIIAQIAADLFQSEGWEAFLIGGGVPYDEVYKLVGEMGPNVLLISGAQPADVPAIRGLISSIREIGVCPTMHILVCGGVFGRADGLWQEVGADHIVSSPREAVHLSTPLGPRQPSAARPPGVVKKRHRRRRNADVARLTTGAPALP
jgi:methanogenic corrinoid protein MtbC1